MIERRRKGIALVLVAGILLLMAGFSVAMLGLAGRLRIGTSAATDHASARLLARSGIEYAAARLGEDNAPKTPANPGNQSDDWTYRDGNDIPVESALNSSYAQTEPYADAPTGNGRYDPGADFFTDANGNGRFDSWSGRLRGRYGMTSGTFHLKIGGTGGSQGGSGGINVNSGIMDPLAYKPDGSPDWDINGNGIPDYRDLEKFWESYYKHYCPINPFSRNVRIAFVLNQLGALLGIGPSPVELAGSADAAAAPVLPLLSISPDDLKNNPSGYATVKANRTAVQAQNAPVPLVPGIGDRIISNRPLGGYRSLDEIGKLFSPADWMWLRDHLTVRSRPNRSAVYRSCSLDTDNFLTSTVCEPDTGYYVDAAAASLQVLAAAFSGMGEDQTGGYVVQTRCEIAPAEAALVAAFLKQYAFTSGFELFQALQRAKGSLFLPVSGDPYSFYAQGDLVSPGFTQTVKAGWVHALAMPDEPGQRPSQSDQRFDLHCWSFATYDFPHVPFAPPVLPNQVPDTHSADWFVRSPKSGALYDGMLKLIEDRDRTVSGPAFALGFGPAPSCFAVESAGKAADARGGLRALYCASASILNEGTIEARTQRDFENFRFDRGPRRGSTVLRFDGGKVAGRPERDRASTTPFFSLDACPGLAQSPLLAVQGIYPGILSTVSPVSPRPYGAPYDYTYCGYGGEVMLAPHSWMDPEAVFYRPCWDLAQPERPPPTCVGLGRGEPNFDDAMRGAKWQRSLGWSDGYLLFGDCRNAPYKSRATPTLGPAAAKHWPVFLWNPADDRRTVNFGGSPEAWVADNRGDFPLVNEGGVVEQGTIEGWYAFGYPFLGGQSVNDERIDQGNPMYVTARYREWSQSGRGAWFDPDPPADGVGDRHVAYAFDAGQDRLAAYMDGIWHGGEGYVSRAVDTGKHQDLQAVGSVFPNELRMYARPLTQTEAQVHALRGRFWTAEPGASDPSFTSPKYAFDGLAELTRIAWDGFVPNVLRDAVGAAYGSEADRDKAPIRVDLLLYAGANPDPIRIELPRESWRTGGAPVDFRALWRKAHPDPDDKPPKISALKYQVWLDVSALERAWNSPVFDGIEIGYKGRGGYSGLREQ